MERGRGPGAGIATRVAAPLPSEVFPVVYTSVCSITDRDRCWMLCAPCFGRAAPARQPDDRCRGSAPGGVDGRFRPSFKTIADPFTGEFAARWCIQEPRHRRHAVTTRIELHFLAALAKAWARSTRSTPATSWHLNSRNPDQRHRGQGSW